MMTGPIQVRGSLGHRFPEVTRETPHRDTRRTFGRGNESKTRGNETGKDKELSTDTEGRPGVDLTDNKHQFLI